MLVYVDVELENITRELIDLINSLDMGISYHTDDFNKILREVNNLLVRGDAEYLSRFPPSLIPKEHEIVYAIFDNFDSVATFINDIMAEWGREVGKGRIWFAIGPPKKPLKNLSAIEDEILRRNTLAIKTRVASFLIDFITYPAYGEIAFTFAKNESLLDDLAVFTSLERLKDIGEILSIHPRFLIIPFEYLITYKLSKVDNKIEVEPARGHWLNILRDNLELFRGISF